MQVPDGALEDFLQGIKAVSNVRGLLLTMPHKNATFAHCSTASETSKLLKVVSITKRNPDGSWHGEMLDGIAFVSAMKREGAKPEGARVLQNGAVEQAARLLQHCLMRASGNWCFTTRTNPALTS